MCDCCIFFPLILNLFYALWWWQCPVCADINVLLGLFLSSGPSWSSRAGGTSGFEGKLNIALVKQVLSISKNRHIERLLLVLQGDRGMPGLPGLDGERVSLSITVIHFENTQSCCFCASSIVWKNPVLIIKLMETFNFFLLFFILQQLFLSLFYRNILWLISPFFSILCTHAY